jgi:branched-chain amino acid transport system ATP-binding protein
MRAWLEKFAMPLLIAALTAGAMLFSMKGPAYASFVLGLVALTIIVGVGLNILLGLTGQVSLGHVGFYAIGAYTVAILTVKGLSFWLALPLAGLIAGIVGVLLALPALRVTGPYLAMVTIAFAFIVQHGTIEWRELTGGANGLMGLQAPAFGSFTFAEREITALSSVLAGISLILFQWIANSGWGKGMVAVRDSEVAARSIGLNPVIIKTAAFGLSAIFAGIAGGIFAPLMMFVAPDSFPFSQSILFLLAVIVGGAGWVLGPVLGAAVSVVLPEMLAGLAEYRLLFFGGLLIVVLWLAPEGIIGSAARVLRRFHAPAGRGPAVDVRPFLATAATQAELQVKGISIYFGGITAAKDVSFVAKPGEITSVIGPNGAGKTTVLNMIGGFYAPQSGSIRLGEDEFAGAAAWKIARAGIARTYQTTKLFPSMSALDNVLVALRRGKLGGLFSVAHSPQDVAIAEGLLAFVDYKGRLDTPAADLPHVDRRLVEIARALAMRPQVLLLDEPAAGLMRSDKLELSKLLRRIADLGIAVILVEHDMLLVMGISDRVVVLDAGQGIADDSPAQVRRDPRVLKAYLGDSENRARPRAAPLGDTPATVLTALRMTAGYGAAPVLENLSFDVRAGEMVALIGANGAGKSTTMRVVSGLLRPTGGEIVLDDKRIEQMEAHKIAWSGLALVPEGRQVFPDLTVLDNLALGANTRPDADVRADIERMLTRFPRLRERLHSRAGLLSGGEQQMLAIARGLMAKPRIILLDEPSLGLAPAMINELFDILAELRDAGVTILLVDQMAALALTVADRGYLLESGRVMRADSAAALAADPALEAAYLGRAEAQ